MENKSKSIFDELFLSIERLGVDGTIKHLQSTESFTANNIELYIFQLICIRFRISKSELLNDDQESKRHYPRIALSYLLYTHTELSLKEVCKITQRGKTTVHRHIQDVKNLSDKFTDQREVIEVLRELETAINTLKTKAY